MAIICTRMNKYDIDSFIECASRFIKESRYECLEPNMDQYRSIILKALKRKGWVSILVAKDDKRVIGYAILSICLDYTAKPFGDMYQFYVLPEYRGTKVGRTLAGMVAEQFDLWGCQISHVCADAGMDEDTTMHLFHNLFAKKGYKRTGIIMTRHMGG